jgi:hypothetical protein
VRVWLVIEYHVEDSSVAAVCASAESARRYVEERWPGATPTGVQTWTHPDVHECIEVEPFEVDG